ncbi:hypothetical protein PSHT_05898, partial [Puccinia striiformis]
LWLRRKFNQAVKHHQETFSLLTQSSLTGAKLHNKVLQKAMAASKAVSCGAHQQQDGLKNQAGGNLQP